MQNHKVVSSDAWLVARKEFLDKEKEFTRLRDQLSQQRRELPWVKVEKEYIFDGPNGKETLAELFAGRSQLLVYHFMFDPSWTEGCKSCSFGAQLQRHDRPLKSSRRDDGDHFQGSLREAGSL